MTVVAKLAAFVVVLAACFGIGLGIGAAVGPIDGGTASPAHQQPSHSQPTSPPVHSTHAVERTR